MVTVNTTPDARIAIAVMGATGTGKTTFINLLSDSGPPLPVGNNLDSCTKEISTAQCTVNDRPVTLIDTPGFDDTTRSETEIIRMIAHFLTSTYQRGIKLSGVIYMHRISDNRMGGLSQRNFKMFKEMCGVEAAKNVVIVTSMWDEVNTARGEAREKELKSLFFKPILDQGAQLLRNDNTPQSALRIIAHFIENQPVPLKIQQEIVDEHKHLDKTGAGVELLKKLDKQQELYRNEIDALKEEMNDIIREKTDEIFLDQQKVIQLLQEKIARVQKDAENMAADFQREREWLERQEVHAGSNGGGSRSIFAARAAKVANVAFQVGAGVASLVYVYGKFLPSPPPPPPPGIPAQVLTAVVSLFQHIH
jgi:Fe2+ transport system protein B